MRAPVAGALASLAALAAGCGGGGGSSTDAASEPPGAALFRANGCGCHTYRGAGKQNLGAPDLTAEASRKRGVAWQVRHLRCPTCVVPGSSMPAYATLSSQNLRKLAELMEQSTG